ncbi:EamA family transporter [Corynebacterium uberis]|uniref:EamA family transporter n=1 Tax=Corynebacterium uberis TaxID=2883169 RepID=UPI001D0ACBCF|nr:EamA family transporter [Corynebacterium uberis]UDL77326.1 EamA family transporter [Corynebacterium uberis]UDL83952.1 EamA family transporter [Corynebacterium uberis]
MAGSSSPSTAPPGALIWLAPGLMVISGLSNYAGAALAVGLFEQFPPWLAAWLRMGSAGLILTVVLRPALRDFWGRAGALAAVYGAVTLAMNTAFYEAIARLPMGTVVAIEFTGPIVVAAVGSRTLREWVAVVCAAGGVVALSGAQWSASASGVILALLAATMWGTYIVVGARISGDAATSTTSMAVGFTWAGIATLPLAIAGWPGQHPGDLDGMRILGVALGLGVLSAVIPYGLDQVILRMAGPAHFAVLLALLPLTAAVLGAVVLHQGLSAAEIGGIAAVVAAVVVRAGTRGQATVRRSAPPTAFDEVVGDADTPIQP